LSGEYFGAEFAAVFSRHCPFEALDDGAHGACVVRKVFGAILDGDVLPFALKFVVGCFVRVLKASPPADVVHEDRGEGGGAAVHGPQEFLECFSSLDAEAAFASVREGAHDEESVLVRVSLDGSVRWSVEYCWCSVDMRMYSAA